MRDVGVVYYLLRLDATGAHIKIGTTIQLKQRMAALSDRSQVFQVLAIEEGGSALERHRHRQFDHLRIGTSEWFAIAGDLIAHIADLGPPQAYCEARPHLSETVNPWRKREPSQVDLADLALSPAPEPVDF